MDLKQISQEVPDYDHFLTVDELNESSHSWSPITLTLPAYVWSDTRAGAIRLS